MEFRPKFQLGTKNRDFRDLAFFGQKYLFLFQNLQKYVFQQYDEYINLLINNFKQAATETVMCLSLLSVGWDGKLYDCDFNQMLNIPLAQG